MFHHFVYPNFLFRWFIVHNDFVNYVREMFSKDNCGPIPPPVMLLSDGGHIENLGLLPLLKKQLKKIIVVDGGSKDDEKSYGKSLLNALMLARKKLGCSFLSGEDGDVISDLMTKFIKPNTRGKRLRYYKLVVIFVYIIHSEFIHSFIHPSIQPAIQPSSHQSIHPSIHSFFLPSLFLNSFIHPAIRPSIHPSIHLHIHPFLRSFVRSLAQFVHSFLSLG